jgi:uncharacterized protein YerC
MIWVLITAMMGARMATTSSRGCDDGEMISLLERHEVQVLLKAGLSVGDVAERSATSADTVRRVRREAAVEHTDDAVARAQRRIGRPSKAAPFVETERAWLAEQGELATQELLRRAQEVGYAGNKTAFYAVVAGVRPPRAAPIVRFEGLPSANRRPGAVTGKCG